MFKIFKTKVPTEEVREIDEVESFTCKWEYYTGWSKTTNTKYKVFTNIVDAMDFETALKNAANLIGCYINTRVYKN